MDFVGFCYFFFLFFLKNAERNLFAKCACFAIFEILRKERKDTNGIIFSKTQYLKDNYIHHFFFLENCEKYIFFLNSRYLID